MREHRHLVAERTISPGEALIDLGQIRRQFSRGDAADAGHAGGPLAVEAGRWWIAARCLPRQPAPHEWTRREAYATARGHCVIAARHRWSALPRLAAMANSLEDRS